MGGTYEKGPRTLSRRLRRQTGLPGRLFRAEPPNDSERCGVLFALHRSEQIRIEIGLVGEIAAPFLAQQETVDQPLFQSDSSVFERLRGAAEEPSPIGKIFNPARDGNARG